MWNKTAIMQLFDALDNHPEDLQLLYDNDFREYYLSKEEFQIKMAYEDFDPRITGETYYNKKYKQDETIGLQK